MLQQPLTTVRRHIERLAGQTGEYVVVCARTGTRPVPVAGKRFPDRRTAAAAARLATAYRAELGRYDGRAPQYDLVVCETPAERSEPVGEPTASAQATQEEPV